MFVMFVDDHLRIIISIYFNVLGISESKRKTKSENDVKKLVRFGLEKLFMVLIYVNQESTSENQRRFDIK